MDVNTRETKSKMSSYLECDSSRASFSQASSSVHAHASGTTAAGRIVAHCPLLIILPNVISDLHLKLDL